MSWFIFACAHDSLALEILRIGYGRPGGSSDGPESTRAGEREQKCVALTPDKQKDSVIAQEAMTEATV